MMFAKHLKVGERFWFTNGRRWSYTVVAGQLTTRAVGNDEAVEPHVMMRVDLGEKPKDGLAYVVLEPAAARGHISRMGVEAEVESVTWTTRIVN